MKTRREEAGESLNTGHQLEKRVQRNPSEVSSSDIFGTDDTSYDSVEVDDEILKRTSSNASCDQNIDLKKERWKYKTRKKRKKTEDLELRQDFLGVLNDMGRTDSKQFSNQNSLRVNRGSREEESSSVDNSVDIDLKKARLNYNKMDTDNDDSVDIDLKNASLKFKKVDTDNDNSVDIDLQNARLKFLKMDPEIQQTECGQGLFKQSVGKLRKLDSGGNSEHQSSSEEGKRRKSTWREQTTECDVCGKEMLKSRLKIHARTAHGSRKLYPCDECSYNAPNINVLKKHLRKTHKLSIETVMKMVEFIKVNRKHRRSIIEDEDEPSSSRPVNKRLLGLSRNITDELHQTGSETENRGSKFKIPDEEDSFQNSDDEGMCSRDLSDEEEADATKDLEELKDSGHESRATTSQDEKTTEDDGIMTTEEDGIMTSDETPIRAEDLLEGMRTLSEDEMPKVGSRMHSKQQLELLNEFNNKCGRPTTKQKEILAKKVGIEARKVQYWFDYKRRILKKSKGQLCVDVDEFNDGSEEASKRAQRGKNTLGLLMSAPSIRIPNVFIEYSAEDMIQSSISVEEMIERDGTICIGVDLTIQDNQCLLCYWSCSFRGNLYKHLKTQHGFTPKCCVLPRSQSNLKPEIKGCRKTFPEESFDLHTCSDQPPVHFRGGDFTAVPIKTLKEKKEAREKKKIEWDSDDENKDKDTVSVKAIIARLKEEGTAVCLGYEIIDELSDVALEHRNTKCLLCDFGTKDKSSLYKHIRRHYNREIKFCSVNRQPTTLLDSKRGCRKVFLADTFQIHTCTLDIPEVLGNFPLKIGGVNVKKGGRPGGGEKRKTGGSYRGYEKNFGVPDGSPAKFYSDRYLRLFSQLGVHPDSCLASTLTEASNFLTSGQVSAVRAYIDDPGENYFLKPQVVPICTECLGTEACNPLGEAESLVSCWGCGQSVHPSCRAYVPELVNYFVQHGWTCDDCKPCIVCDTSPSECERSEDLLVCEYCDQGIHYACLNPQPEKKPKVWNCDDCRIARGMKPLGNIKKFRAEVADLVTKTAAKSFFANRSLVGYEDSDSLDANVVPVVLVEDDDVPEEQQEETVGRPESAPPPLSPQADLPVLTTAPPQIVSPPPPPTSPAPVRDKKRINAALPAGVTEKDVQLFTRSQEKAKAFLIEENKGLEEDASPREKVGPGPGSTSTPRFV